MNRIEAFKSIIEGNKVQQAGWVSAGWYLEFGGLPSFAGGAPDQVMFVNGESKTAYTHWPDVEYIIYEVKKEVTQSALGKSITSEASKLGLSTDQTSSLISGVSSSLGF
jgi:hypothetical protein